MFRKTDPYSFTKYTPLFQENTQVGNLVQEYQVTLYDKVQMTEASDVRQAKNRQYHLLCTQRISIWNPDSEDVSPVKDQEFYDNYPVMLNTDISIAETALGIQLLEYSPRTVNTKIQMSGSSGNSSGRTKGSSSQSTVGSSTSETNSYGTSVSVGFMGDALTGGATASFEHSTTDSHSRSRSAGTESSASRGHDTSSAASMSVKDWGAYAMVHPQQHKPTWTFGQEYPWDVIQCRKTDNTPYKPNPNQVRVIIPAEMSARLYDGIALYPPSQLAIFGIDFVMKASWLIAVPDGAESRVHIDHNINYFSASHAVLQDKHETVESVGVYVDKEPSILHNDEHGDTHTTSLDLSLMALDPLGTKANAAIIGFIPSKFIVRPGGTTDENLQSKFEIISATNDLKIIDTTPYMDLTFADAGFSASETALTARFDAMCRDLYMTLYFKVTDLVDDYTLTIKHWKSGSVGVVLTFRFNDDQETVIRKYVDTEEAEGGENNLLSVSLRTLDYASIDYHDFLQLGLNSVEIGIQPIGDEVGGCEYQVRAISIEKD